MALDQQKIRLSVGLVAAGSVAVASPQKATATEIKNPRVGQTKTTAASASPQNNQVVGTESALKFSVAAASEFTNSDKKRFLQLARKRADGIATESDNREFAELQRARRMAPENFSSEEVLQEYRRRQMLIDVVDVLNKHVQFFLPQDQARIRSFGQAH